MFGILSYDDIDLIGHCAYKNYRTALYNYFGYENFKEVRSHFDKAYNHADNLNGISHLFIIDEHQIHNNAAWRQPGFQEQVNAKNIRVIIFNFEKIYNSKFSWNADNQKAVEQFRNYHQFVADIEDAKIMKKTVVTKTYMSKDTVLNVKPCIKQDKIVFIGQMNGDQYDNRRNIIYKFKLLPMEFDVISTDRKLTYDEFLNKLNGYKYALSPLGTGQFLSLRYYELLHMGIIPIQEVNDNILKWYPEIANECICFEKNMPVDEIYGKICSFHGKTTEKYYLEDYITNIQLKKYL